MARGNYNGSSPNSRSSRTQMPSIAEDEDPSRTNTPPPAALRAHRSQRRVPQKISQSAPPPYVPVTHISPPRYYEGDGSGGLTESSESRESSSVYTSEKRLSGQQHQERATGGNRLKRWTDRQWHGSRRKRWGIFIGLGLLAIGLIAGLAVGLTLGLRESDDSESTEQDGSNSEPKDPTFPAGSYSFNTRLQETTTSCTSRSTTWRCYPFEEGKNATFFWVIHSQNASDANSPSYTVSSTDNPFAPSFTNLTATVAGRDTPDERLTFFFDMDKTVVPSDSLTPSNQAALCTFGGTRFEATIWTRRKDGKEIGSDREAGSNFAAWPADVEVVQSKQSEEDQPRCEDRDGNRITDVQAADGECVCGYANFDKEQS